MGTITSVSVWPGPLRMSASRGATFRRRYREVRALSLKSVALWVSQAAAALVVVAALISCDKERLSLRICSAFLHPLGSQ